MSRKLDLAPFAFTTDGAVLLNLAMFDARRTLEDILKLASRESGAIFVGVAITRAEREIAARRACDGLREAAAFAVGKRQGLAWSRKREA